MNRFYNTNPFDKRLNYASEYLESMGYLQVKNPSNADIQLMPPSADVEYKKQEDFLIENAYLTAEAALAEAIAGSEISLINSSVLIVGFGRIGKALLSYLKPFTADITVCARSESARALASAQCCTTIEFEALKNAHSYDYIFNTVPFPVFNDDELTAVPKESLLLDLASFPGGVDEHLAKSMGINLIVARGLPNKFSPKTAGSLVARAVDKSVKEGRL